MRGPTRYRRSTTTRRRQPMRTPVLYIVLAASIVIFLTWKLAGGGGDLSQASTCAGGACAGEVAAAHILPPVEGPAAAIQKPCPYCNQDPQRWRSLTAVAPPEISGSNAALIEASCGRLVYGLRENEHRPPASIAKIVTALVTADSAQLSDRVTVKTSGWTLASEDGSSIAGLEAGQNVSVEDLLYGLMLPSGNDAALALADHFGGNAKFVPMMQARISKLGLANTQLTNPDGRDAAGNYTSALDIVLLGRELMSNPALRRIAGTQTAPASWDGHTLWNTNYLVYGVQGATGVKFGYTEAAKETIVGAAMRNGRELYVSVLSSDYAYLDAKKLLEWGFANTTPAC